MTIAPERVVPETEALILGLDEYIRARYGLLAVQTFEEERFLRFMRGVADHERHRAKGLYVWSRTKGLRLLAGPGVGPDGRAIPNREDAISVIEHIEEAEQGLYVLCDFAPYLIEYGAPKPELVRRLRELAWAIRSRPVTVIFLGARFPDIPELEKEVKILDLPLPEEAETAGILDRETERLRANPSATVELDQDARSNLIQALLGLTATEMENVLAKSAVRDRGFGATTARLVLDEKRDLIRKTAALAFTPPVPLDEVGGYQPVRRLLRLAALTFSPEARQFGVEEAKGLLLVGLPGCGKDLIARAASSVLGRALLQLDVGAVMGEGGGLLGSAEFSIKRALQIATTAKCVLAISEYEKAVGGMRSSASTDGGATGRVVGSLLSWLAEPHPGVFVIATANDVRELAPEQIREGRFTPVFVDLPTPEDRAAIFAVHLRKRRRDPSEFDLELLAAGSDGYSGAEIESAVKSAVLEAFADGQRILRTDDIVQSIAAIRPLSQVKPAEIEDLRRWAREALAIDANRGAQLGAAEARSLEL
jgi:ATP-dependent 26S proteasome regulatory subunit